ncbi:MAG: CpaF family protein [Polyangiales bacterium]
MTIPREVFEQTIFGFFEPIRKFFDDDSVSEIMINGPNEIYIEQNGRLTLTDARFQTLEALYSALRNLSQYVGRQLDEEHPILEARLPDGSRVEAVIPPAAPDGPSVSIRRFAKETLTIDTLIRYGALSQDAADTLRVLVASKQNIVVSGGTSSGKTALLNALSSFAGQDDRIVVIEDARELQLQLPHVVQMEAQPPNVRGRGEVSIRDLFKASLRMRPDRIVVGEIRGAEAIELIQAMTSGHGGCLSTVHASHPVDTMTRLETMAMMSEIEIPLFALRAQVASAVNFVVQTSRMADKSRGITHITEVVGYNPEKGYQLRDIFVRKFGERGSDGRVPSKLVATGQLPACVDAIRAAGMKLPDAVLSAAKSRGDA